MKFKRDKGAEVVEVAAGTQLYRLDDDQPELSTWEADAIAALTAAPGAIAVEEKVEDVVKFVPDASDRELKTMIQFDRRDGVEKAASAELAKRHREATKLLDATIEERRRAELEDELAALDTKAVATRRDAIAAELAALNGEAEEPKP